MFPYLCSPVIIAKMDTIHSASPVVRPGYNPASKKQMKPKSLFLVLAIILAACQSSAISAPDTTYPPLRDDPPEQIIADLDAYIPDRMAQGNIPGLTVALIQDNQIVWTEGYGVTNRFSNKPMQADAVFEVASLSKVVGAYTTMQLVDDGLLSLDEPIYSYLPTSWNPGTPYDNEVTLLDLLSHSAGIFNQGEATPPGESFYYTGFGYARVQRVLQNKSERDLEDLAREYTLDPLGMTSTSYTSPASLQPRLVKWACAGQLPGHALSCHCWCFLYCHSACFDSIAARMEEEMALPAFHLVPGCRRSNHNHPCRLLVRLSLEHPQNGTINDDCQSEL